MTRSNNIFDSPLFDKKLCCDHNHNDARQISEGETHIHVEISEHTQKCSKQAECLKPCYKDLLNRLGVQGHDGAVAEITALRKNSGLDKSKQEDKLFTVIPLDKQNRMLRLGIGKNKNRWFIRVDLWFVALRLAEVS